jgi:hypothetical protein
MPCARRRSLLPTVLSLSRLCAFEGAWVAGGPYRPRCSRLDELLEGARAVGVSRLGAEAHGERREQRRLARAVLTHDEVDVGPEIHLELVVCAASIPTRGPRLSPLWPVTRLLVAEGEAQ